MSKNYEQLQDWDNLDIVRAKFESLEAELERVKLDWTELRDILNLPSTDCDKALVIQAIRHVKAERDEALKRELALTVHCNLVEHQRDGLLEALKLGRDEIRAMARDCLTEAKARKWLDNSEAYVEVIDAIAEAERIT